MKNIAYAILISCILGSMHASTPKLQIARTEKKIELPTAIDPILKKASSKQNVAQVSKIKTEQIAEQETTTQRKSTLPFKAAQPKDKKSGEMTTNENSIKKTYQNFEQIYDKSTDTFTNELHDIFNKFIRKSVFLTLKHRMRFISYMSLSDMFVISVKHLLFALFNISENLTPRKNNALNNFRKQIQYLAEQIEKYNNTTIYKKPQAMIDLMLFMQQFLQENNEFPFSSPMLINLDQTISTATTCCNIFKNQNMIFASSNSPAEIIQYFQQAIDNTNNLQNIKFTRNLINKIYDDGGYTDQIMQTWQKFTASDLNQTPVNRHYAAFLTFLLLFENMIVATAVIIDQTSALYKVTNPVSVTIDIA